MPETASRDIFAAVSCKFDALKCHFSNILRHALSQQILFRCATQRRFDTFTAFPLECAHLAPLLLTHRHTHTHSWSQFGGAIKQWPSPPLSCIKADRKWTTNFTFIKNCGHILLFILFANFFFVFFCCSCLFVKVFVLLFLSPSELFVLLIVFVCKPARH